MEAGFTETVLHLSHSSVKKLCKHQLLLLLLWLDIAQEDISDWVSMYIIYYLCRKKMDMLYRPFICPVYLFCCLSVNSLSQKVLSRFSTKFLPSVPIFTSNTVVCWRLNVVVMASQPAGYNILDDITDDFISLHDGIFRSSFHDSLLLRNFGNVIWPLWLTNHSG